MSDSRISFSKDVASTIGLSEAVLLEVLKESGLKGRNLNELQNLLSFWTEKEVTEYLKSLLSKGLVVENKTSTLSSFVVKEIQTEHLNQEKEEKNKSWGIKFLRFVIKQWRQKEATDNQKRKRQPIETNWKPEDEAREILVRSGVDNDFIDKEVPEFVLYWSEKKEESDIWNSKFIAHIRRQWGRFQNVNEKDDLPFKIDSKWLPNEDFYDVLTLTNIPKEFADSTLSEFILYWKETGQSHNSWNSKFLQHVKFQWQKQNQNLSSQGQNLMDKRIESSWNISEPVINKKKGQKVSEQTKLNLQRLREKHQI